MNKRNLSLAELEALEELKEQLGDSFYKEIVEYNEGTTDDCQRSDE